MLLCNSSFCCSFCRSLVVFLSVILVVTSTSQLQALPPLDVDLVDSNTVEVSWPDTGEAVELEFSSDLGSLRPWETHPGAPALDQGTFRQVVNSDDEEGFFRLASSEVDPSTPSFNDPPSNLALFPGQTVGFVLSATDPGGLPLSYLAEPLPLPEGALLNKATGEFTWTPTESQIGTVAITFLAFNGTNNGRQPVSITVQRPPAEGSTSLSGILLDTTDAVGGEDRPVVGAVVSLLGSGISMTTGADGRFVLNNVAEGNQVLDIANRNSRARS